MSTQHTMVRRIATGLAQRTFSLLDRARGTRQRYLLVLSHMRAGSSLLLHVLMSNCEVIGCGERSARYGSTRDLRQLALQAYWEHRMLRPSAYVVDQINHDKLLADESLLRLSSVRPLILVRPPAPSISSLVEVLGQHYELDLDYAVRYYQERLRTLTRYGTCADAAFLLTYPELVHRTSDALGAVQRFLELEDGFREEYDSYAFTGVRGDPSPTIRAGHIVRTERLRTTVIPSATLAVLEEQYQESLATLRSRCAHLTVET